MIKVAPKNILKIIETSAVEDIWRKASQVSFLSYQNIRMTGFRRYRSVIAAILSGIGYYYC